jgi:hypothetical protein
MLILLVRGSKQANVFIADQNLKKKIVTLASGKQCNFFMAKCMDSFQASAQI